MADDEIVWDGRIGPLSLVEKLEPATLCIAPGGNMMVTLHQDGRLEYGANYNPDDAARYLWNSIRQLMITPHYPPLEGYTSEELRDELVRRGAWPTPTAHN